MKRKNGLLKKATAALILIIIIPVLIVGIIATNKAKTSFEENLKLTSAQAIKQVDDGLGQHLNGIAQQVITLADNEDIKNFSIQSNNKEEDTKRIQSLLKSVKNTTNDVLNVCYASEDGEILLDSGVLTVNEFNYKEREWYKQAQKDKNVIYTKPITDAVTKQQVISVVKAAYDDNGKFIGATVLDIKLDAMVEYIKNTNILNSGYMILADNDGNVIINNGVISDDENINSLPFWQNDKNEKSDAYEWQNNGDINYVVQRTNKDTGWKLIGFVNENEISQAIGTIKLATVIGGIIAVIIGIIAGVCGSIIIIKQINKIKESVKKVAEGRFDRKS